MGIKNAQFDADFKFVEKVEEKVRGLRTFATVLNDENQ